MGNIRKILESLKEDTLSYSFNVKELYPQCCDRHGATAEKVVVTFDNYDGYDEEK